MAIHTKSSSVVHQTPNSAHRRRLIGSKHAFLRGFFILGFLGVAGCATQPPVEVYLTNIAPMPSTLFEQRVRLDLRVQNLTEKPVRATGADVQLMVNGRQLARGVSSEPVEVAPLGETATSVVVSSSVFDTVRQLLGLPGRTSFTYALRGKLFTNGFNRRFKRSGELTREDLGRLFPAAGSATNREQN